VTSRSSTPRSPQQRRAQQIEDTTRVVVRALRHALERGRFSVEDAADIALVQLFRPGGPAKLIGRDARERLSEAVRKLARAIDDVSKPRALLAFARASSEAAWSLASSPRHPGARIDEVALGDARTLAHAAVYATATQARDPEDHVRRAVARAVRERRRQERGNNTQMTRLPLHDGDPLRAVLDVPARGRVSLPKSDVRTHLAKAAHHTALGVVLRQAARFAEDVVRPAIGEELWSLCRPVGFADKLETRILVEVGSALVAHEVQLRSLELVHRLRAVPSFAKVTSMKLVVVEPTARPILTPRGSA
jgi:hypothetical protein